MICRLWQRVQREFAHLFAQIQDDRQFCLRTKRQITITRRIIRAKVDQALENAFRGPWRELSAAFEALLRRLPRANATPERLLDMLEWLCELKVSVEQAFQAAFKRADEVVENTPQTSGKSKSNETQYMNPKGSVTDPHILDTKQLNPVSSNTLEKRKAKRAAVRIAKLPDPVESKDISWSTFGKKGTRIRD